MTISRAVGNGVGLGDWVFRLGTVLLCLERADEASASLQEALTIYEEMDNRRGQANVLACLAQAALAQEDIVLAATYIRQSISVHQNLYRQMQQATPTVSPIMSTQLGFSADDMDSFLRVVLVAAAQHRFEYAATLFGIAQALLEQSGYRPVPPLEAKVAQAAGKMGNHLSKKEFTAACEAGRAIPANEVLAFAAEI